MPTASYTLNEIDPTVRPLLFCAAFGDGWALPQLGGL